MANTIKLKRGSGSDPSASDLSVGEIAIRTDSGKLFTKKDDGSVAEISGSGGIDDGDKGDITVSNSGATFTIDNGVVTSAKIADGTIVNADISSLANIDGSKIQAAGLVNSGVMTAAQHNKLAGIEANATADMTATEILAVISGENIILGTVSSTGNSTFAGNVTLSSSDGGSSAAPELDLYRVSASPADADYLGQIKFSGESDDDSKQVYAKITGKIGDASSGTEDGIIEIAHRKAGSNNISARFTSTDLKLINGTGLEVAGDTTLSGNLEISSTVPTINFVDTDNNSDFSVRNENGVFKIVDTTNSTTRFQIISSGITNIEAPLNVNGNFITSGTATINGGNLTISGTSSFLKLNDTDDNPDYKLFNIGGVFQIFDDTNAEVRLKVSTGGNVQIPADNKKFQIGASNDLELFHDSNDSIINDAGTGNLKLQLGGSTKLEVTSAGATLTGDLEISSTAPKIVFTDSDHNPDYEIIANAGTFTVKDVTNNASRIYIETSGTINLANNVNALAGLDATGALTATTFVQSPKILGSNGIIEMKQEIGSDHTLSTGYNAIAVDPTIANGVTVTVPSGAVWSIV